MHFTHFTYKNPLSEVKQFIGFLDLETTGLCKHNDFIICAGLIYIEKDTLHLKQWIIEDEKEEEILIHLILKEFSKFEKCYTYNGLHFEVPFLLEKMNLYHINHDLYNIQLVRNLKRAKCSRTYLEQTIGFERLSRIEGKELAKLCKVLLKDTTHPHYASLILEHNKDELMSLVQIKLFDNFIASLNSHTLVASNYTEDHISLTFKPSISYDKNCHWSNTLYRCDYNMSNQTFNLLLSCPYQTLRTYLPYKDYYLVNGELMHKSLAMLLPTSVRQKPRKSECYIEKTAYYSPIILTNPSLIWEDASKQTYELYEPDVFKECETEIVTKLLLALQKKGIT